MNNDALKKAIQKKDLRTLETNKRYCEFLRNKTKDNCIFCDRELFVKEYKYWIIIKNRFPYDEIAEVNHMLATKRHVSGEENLKEEERLELYEIKKNELANYSVILESLPRCATIPSHFHIHLLKYHTQK